MPRQTNKPNTRSYEIINCKRHFDIFSLLIVLVFVSLVSLWSKMDRILRNGIIMEALACYILHSCVVIWDPALSSPVDINIITKKKK